MEKLIKIAVTAFLIIYSIFALFLGASFITGAPYFSFPYFQILSIILTVILIFLLRNKNIKITNKVFIVLVIIGIILNFSLLFLKYEDVFSDYATFFYNALSFAKTNTFSSPSYLAIFPHLSGYVFFLGTIMKVIGSKYMTVLIVNFIFNLIGTFLIYQIFKENNNLAKIASLIYLINPLNMVWATASIPIVIFQTMFLLSIYLLEKLLIYQDNKKKFIIYSIITGIVVGLANLFRPIMIIYLIALVIYYFYLFLIKRSKSLLLMMISIILIFAFYSIVGKVNTYFLDKVSNYSSSSLPGWNVYVGSVLPFGTWTEELGEDFNRFTHQENFTPERLQQDCLKLGIKNYQSLSFKNLIYFMKDKFLILTRSLEYYTTYFLEARVNISKTVRDLVYICLTLYIGFCLTASFISILKYRKIKNDKIIFYALLVIGITIASLLLEVNFRYIIPIYVPLFLMAINSFKKKPDLV